MKTQRKTKNKPLAEFSDRPQPAELLQGGNHSHPQDTENATDPDGRYKILFENIKDPLMVFDVETLRLEDANTATLSLLGYSRKEFFELKLPDISAEKEKTKIAVGQMTSGEIAHQKIPMRYVLKKDGSSVPVEISSGMFLSEGRKKIIGILRDISQRIKAEENLRNFQKNLENLVEKKTRDLKRTNEKLTHEIIERERVENALREAEKRNANIIATITDYIYTVYIQDNQPVKTIHYPHSVSITGYAPEEFEENPYLWIKMVPEEDRRTVISQTEMLLSGKSCEAIEHRIIRKDGEIRWVRNTTVPFYDENGRLVSYDGIIRDITERKKAEMILQESEEKFRILSEKSPNMIFINQNGQVAYANERCEKTMGYTKAEFCAPDFDFLCLVAPEDREMIMENFSRHKKGEELNPYEYTLITKNGEKINALITTKLIDYQGKIAILGMVTDITKRKTAERALEWRLALERTISSLSSRFVSPANLDQVITDSLADIGKFSMASRSYLFVFNEDGTVFNNTHEWCAEGVMPQIDNLKELSSDSFPWWIGKLKREEIIHIEDIEQLPSAAKSEKEILQKQNVKSAIVLPVTFSGKLIGFIGFDDVVHTGLWTKEDLHLLKIFSEILGNALQHRQAEEILRFSDQRNKALLEAMPDMMFVLRRDGTLKDIKTKGKKYLPLPPAELIGKPVKLVGFSDAEVRMLKRSIERVVADGKIETLQFQLKTETGPEIFEARISRLDKNEVLANVRNITHEKKLEEQLIKNEKLESLGVLAGGIAHDFNNLLTAILGNISLARMYKDAWGKVDQRLEAAEKASSQARELTQQLLTFSRGGEPIKKTISIADLVKESAVFALRGSSEICKFKLSENLWPVEADPGQMSQVIQNLLINADHAMPEGGTITISCKNIRVSQEESLPIAAGNYVKMILKDQGAGIPREHISKIFDPYFSTKQKGSGLGLTTVYSIVKKHAGHISVSSELGKGTTFTIYLPASHQKLSEKKEADELPFQASGKVLVMDDEDVVRDIAGNMLRKFGFQVDLAPDGSATIRMYKDALKSGQPYKIVLMDLTIPGGKGGKETIKKLLKIDPQVNALVSSGYSNDPIMSEYTKFGFKGVIAKPYKFEELRRVFQRIYNQLD